MEENNKMDLELMWRRKTLAKQIEKTYDQDIKDRIKKNRESLDNWVNVEYKGVIIPLTKQELSIWRHPRHTREDKRKTAAKIKALMRAGKHEYFSVNGVMLIRPLSELELIEGPLQAETRRQAKMDSIRRHIDNILQQSQKEDSDDNSN